MRYVFTVYEENSCIRQNYMTGESKFVNNDILNKHNQHFCWTFKKHIKLENGTFK